MTEHLITLEYPPTIPESFAIVEELLFHCEHVQSGGKEVVVSVNPHVTAYEEGLLEITVAKQRTILVFDIQKKEKFSFRSEGKTYEIEFQTWQQTRLDRARFDFRVVTP